MVTGGGQGVTSGRRRIALLAAIAALLAYCALQLWANVGSILTESEGTADPREVWTLEITSLIGWFVVVALLWRALPHMVPPRRTWPTAVALLILAAPIASALHVGVMVALREIAWALAGGDYSFPTGAQGWPYELRKDIADYVVLIVLMGALRWYLARDDGGAAEANASPMLEVVDGTRRIRLPHGEIAMVEAAGNYVELHTAGTTHLHRATMAAITDELGPAFARIHRSRLVRKDAIRQVETLSSGDFIVTLDGGVEARGSRRYRDSLD